jgi:gas vesicle protein
MRFIIGLLLGFGAGFAGAVLFAPDRSKKDQVAGRPAGSSAASNGRGENHNGGLRGALRSLQDQISTAMSEAKQASEETEVEMRSRYEQAAGRKAGNGKK